MTARLAGAILITLVTTASAESGPTSGALTNEDVVMMTAAGESEAEIIAAIRAWPEVDFDLSSEVVDELRLAGVSDAVLDAMRHRQRQGPILHDERDMDPEDFTAGMELGSVKVILNGLESDSRRIELKLFDEVHPELSHRYRLRSGGTGVRITDLAVFVIAHHPTLAPDQWQTESILIAHPTVRRHWVVAAQTGAERDSARWYHSLSSTGPTLIDKELHVLTLDLDPVFAFQLPVGESIDLSIGLGLRLGEGDGGGYYVWQLSELQDVRASKDRTVELHAKLSGARSKSLEKVRIEFKR